MVECQWNWSISVVDSLSRVASTYIRSRESLFCVCVRFFARRFHLCAKTIVSRVVCTYSVGRRESQPFLSIFNAYPTICTIWSFCPGLICVHLCVNEFYCWISVLIYWNENKLNAKLWKIKFMWQRKTETILFASSTILKTTLAQVHKFEFPVS